MLNLKSYAILNMETMGYFESTNSLIASEIRMSGALDFFQSGNFQDKVIYNDYSVFTIVLHILIENPNPLFSLSKIDFCS
jgi:hypothetical protein